MKQPRITIEEYISLTEEELDRIIEQQYLLSTENSNESFSFIDLHGMTIAEVAKKYNFISHEELKEKLKKRFRLSQ